MCIGFNLACWEAWRALEVKEVKMEQYFHLNINVLLEQSLKKHEAKFEFNCSIEFGTFNWTEIVQLVKVNREVYPIK